MKRWLLAGTVALATGGQTLASDLPPPAAAAPPRAPAAYVPPPPSPVYNWGGVYFGFNLGYGFGTSKWTDPKEPPDRRVISTFGASWLGLRLASTSRLTRLSMVPRPTSTVLGSTARIRRFCPNPCETKSFWNSTLRARFGYAADRILFYGTGGGALANVSAGISGGSLQRSTKAGWTAGAGIEAAFTDNLTARIEYLFVDLQHGVCNVGSQCGFPAPNVPLNASVNFSTSMIRLGVDYKFR